MGRLVHFEIHADDMERAKKFYSEVFGWTFEDWSEYAGMPYFGAVTGDPSEPGVNGALIKRQGPAPEPGQAVNGYACTLGVGNYDATEALILQFGASLQCRSMRCREWPGKDIISIQKVIFLGFISLIHRPNKFTSAYAQKARRDRPSSLFGITKPGQLLQASATNKRQAPIHPEMLYAAPQDQISSS